LKQLRTVEEVAAKRGLTVPEVLGLEKKAPQETKESEDNE